MGPDDQIFPHEDIIKHMSVDDDLMSILVRDKLITYWDKQNIMALLTNYERARRLVGAVTRRAGERLFRSVDNVRTYLRAVFRTRLQDAAAECMKED
jgi:hypothetical protein